MFKTGSYRSAKEIVPIVMDLTKPSSVIDVGCGVGTWLKAFQEAGVVECNGYDGGYVDRNELIIEQSRFHEIDLAKENHINRKSDLATCLEVGEHIPEKRSRSLVSILVNIAPVVVFSAAMPGQGGTHHINEQWPSFWQALFREHDYQRIDAIRPKIWLNTKVEWWYKQNITVYAHINHIDGNPKLKSEYELTNNDTYELVNKQVIDSVVSRYTLSGTLRSMPSILLKAILRRFYR
jgi:SAM-dependent methyltransferase